MQAQTQHGYVLVFLNIHFINDYWLHYTNYIYIITNQSEYLKVIIYNYKYCLVLLTCQLHTDYTVDAHSILIFGRFSVSSWDVRCTIEFNLICIYKLSELSVIAQ
jgi:hypothetical protein